MSLDIITETITNKAVFSGTSFTPSVLMGRYVLGDFAEEQENVVRLRGSGVQLQINPRLLLAFNDLANKLREVVCISLVFSNAANEKRDPLVPLSLQNVEVNEVLDPRTLSYRDPDFDDFISGELKKLLKPFGYGYDEKLIPANG